jgi:asparaginyl-tRNA synthetase
MVIKALRDFLVDNNFIELMPVITSVATDPLAPDPGSSIIGIPKIKYYDEELVLTQSMILHKQISLVSGLDRIFVFSPNIRLERRDRGKTGRHLFEFTQLDFEIAYGDMNFVMDLVEDMIIYVINKLLGSCKGLIESFNRSLTIPRKPFKRYTTHELIDEFGEEWEYKVSIIHKDPVWVVCHKREFYDREDPEKPGHFRNYDLVWPEGYGEALSGGEREWQYDKIVNRVGECSDVISFKGFKNYLYMARKGFLRPSAGGGLGIERFIRFLIGARHVGDVQLFRRVPGEKILF